MDHTVSPMKVGVDGVLLGAWSNVGELNKAAPCRILDIGCGCGLISLMAAQRNPDADITGIEIDSESAKECLSNFKKSKWEERLKVVNEDVVEWASREEGNFFDYVVSNPPFFKSGIVNPKNSREKARHEGSLSPSAVISLSKKLLKDGGEVSVIAPASEESILKLKLQMSDFKILRICRISDNPNKEAKRIMLCCRKGDQDRNIQTEEQMLHIKKLDGSYSDKYCELTRDFYLNF